MLSNSVAALKALAVGFWRLRWRPIKFTPKSKLQEVGQESESIFNFSKFNFQYNLGLYEPPECSSLLLIVHLTSVISQFTPQSTFLVRSTPLCPNIKFGQHAQLVCTSTRTFTERERSTAGVQEGGCAHHVRRRTCRATHERCTPRLLAHPFLCELPVHTNASKKQVILQLKKSTSSRLRYCKLSIDKMGTLKARKWTIHKQYESARVIDWCDKLITK